MAKWGEGDPRWIVEHRDDGKNVNNWHWSEVNRMEWSRKRLAELLPGAEARLEGGGAAPLLTRVTALKSCTGEAMLTTRKGNKRFAFYDLKLTVAWEAVPAAAAEAQAQAADGAAPDGAAAGGDGADAGAEQQGGASAAPAAAPAAPSSGTISGEISVGEFGSGSDHDDLELGFTVNGGSAAEQAAVRAHVERQLWPAVLSRLEQFVRELADS